jgi:heme-degrading monooxygenase HmoA
MRRLEKSSDIKATLPREALTAATHACHVAPMVIEIALLRAKPDAAEQLRDGLRNARSVIARASGYLGSEFYQGIEDPRSFILRVDWDRIEAHLHGFRQSPLLAEWRSHFYHLLDTTPTVTHYESIAGPS